jgi:hypothetical protein
MEAGPEWAERAIMGRKKGLKSKILYRKKKKYFFFFFSRMEFLDKLKKMAQNVPSGPHSIELKKGYN